MKTIDEVLAVLARIRADREAIEKDMGALAKLIAGQRELLGKMIRVVDLAGKVIGKGETT